MKQTILILSFCLCSIAVQAESIDQVVIKKKAHRLIVIKNKVEIAGFSIALGQDPEGQKNCDGDGKTPEGNYIISSRNSTSKFYRSLKISYPNEADKLRAKYLKCSPGGEIMIHGLPNGNEWLGSLHRNIDWTKGCVAVTNAEIDQIWALVPVGTKVRIEP